MPRRAVFITIGSLVVVAVGVLIKTAARSQPTTGPGPLAVSVATTLTTFNPADAAPLAFAPKGQFVLSAPPGSVSLHRFNIKNGTDTSYDLPAPIVSATLNPAEQKALVHSTTWSIVDLTNKELTTIDHLLAADWLDDTTLIAVTDSKKIGTLKLGTRIITPSTAQPDFGNANTFTVESNHGQTLIGATTSQAELPLTRYWLVTSTQQLIVTPFDNAVWATLTTDGKYVITHTINDPPVRYERLSDQSTGTVDDTKIDLPVVGTYQNQYVTILADTTSEAASFWRITLFTPGGESVSKKVLAPVSWIPRRFFVAGSTVYAYGDGLLYHSSMTALLSQAIK